MPVQPTDEEEIYFLEVERERRAKLRKELDKAASDLQQKRNVAAAVKTDDIDLAQRIHALGFDGDTGRIFDLMPLIHVAWADGKIQRGERASILSVLEARRIPRESGAFAMVESMLEERPSSAFLDESLALLRQLVKANDQQARDIVQLCAAVADASGGFLGLVGQKVSDDERQLIARVAANLGSVAQRAFKARFED